MGCGKSTLGKKLAYNIEYDYIDLDIYIQEQEGKSIKEIFVENGEDYFRKLERACLKKVINNKKTVISVGGGTPCYFDNIQLMNENGLTIYINMHPKYLISRLQSSEKFRPLIDGMQDDELLDFVYKKLKEREGFYKKSHKSVNGFDLSVKKLKEYCSLD